MIQFLSSKQGFKIRILSKQPQSFTYNQEPNEQYWLPSPRISDGQLHPSQFGPATKGLLTKISELHSIFKIFYDKIFGHNPA